MARAGEYLTRSQFGSSMPNVLLFSPPHHNPTHFVRATARAPTCPRPGGGGRWRRLRERRVAARVNPASGGWSREQAMLRQRLNRRQPAISRESNEPAFGRRGSSRRKSFRKEGARRGGARPAPGAARSRTLHYEYRLISGEVTRYLGEIPREGQEIWQPPVLCSRNKRVRNGNVAFGITERRRPLEC